MRKLSTLTLAPTLSALLAAVILAGCGAGGSPTTARSAGDGERTTTSAAGPDSEATDRSGTAAAPATTEPEPATAPPTTAAPVAGEPSTATTSPPAPPADGRRYLCPEGGIDAVRALQRAVDQGHQPWRLSAEDVAAACTYGVPAATVEPAGQNRYRVTETASGDQLLVTVAQPLGPGTVWAVTLTTPA